MPNTTATDSNPLICAIGDMDKAVRVRSDPYVYLVGKTVFVKTAATITAAASGEGPEMATAMLHDTWTYVLNGDHMVEQLYGSLNLSVLLNPRRFIAGTENRRRLLFCALGLLKMRAPHVATEGWLSRMLLEFGTERIKKMELLHDPCLWTMQMPLKWGPIPSSGVPRNDFDFISHVSNLPMSMVFPPWASLPDSYISPPAISMPMSVRADATADRAFDLSSSSLGLGISSPSIAQHDTPPTPSLPMATPLSTKRSEVGFLSPSSFDRERVISPSATADRTFDLSSSSVGLELTSTPSTPPVAEGLAEASVIPLAFPTTIHALDTADIAQSSISPPSLYSSDLGPTSTPSTLREDLADTSLSALAFPPIIGPSHIADIACIDIPPPSLSPKLPAGFAGMTASASEEEISHASFPRRSQSLRPPQSLSVTPSGLTPAAEVTTPRPPPARTPPALPLTAAYGGTATSTDAPLSPSSSAVGSPKRALEPSREEEGSPSKRHKSSSDRPSSPRRHRGNSRNRHQRKMEAEAEGRSKGPTGRPFPHRRTDRSLGTD